MTDALKKMARVIEPDLYDADRRDEWDDTDYAENMQRAKTALATLTPGSTWATEDGVEVMVVPVEATSVMMEAGYQHRFNEDRSTAGLYRAMLSAVRKE